MSFSGSANNVRFRPLQDKTRRTTSGRAERVCCCQSTQASGRRQRERERWLQLREQETGGASRFGRGRGRNRGSTRERGSGFADPQADRGSGACAQPNLQLLSLKRESRLDFQTKSVKASTKTVRDSAVPEPKAPTAHSVLTALCCSSHTWPQKMGCSPLSPFPERFLVQLLQRFIGRPLARHGRPVRRHSGQRCFSSLVGRRHIDPTSVSLDSDK